MSKPVERKGFVDRMQSLSRHTLYLLLVIVVSAPLLIAKFGGQFVIPTKPKPATIGFYAMVGGLDPAKGPVVVQTDWTNSSRGESMGEFEALMRIFIARKIKFAFYGAADVQSPEVARNTLRRVAEEFPPEERPVAGQDYVDLGFFPDAEAINNQMEADLRKAWAGKTYRGVDVFQSPVLKDVRSLADVQLLINITASETTRVLVQRITKTKLAAMVTGVMGPETINYFQSGQMVGVVVGLRGTVELETMMARGINHSEGGKLPFVEASGLPVIEPLPIDKPYGRGMNYFTALHTALGLLILAVVAGNVGLIISRRGGRKNV